MNIKFSVSVLKESFMTPEKTDLTQRSGMKLIYRFFGGAALGALMVSVPLTYGSSIDLNLVQVGLIALVVLSSGVLSSLWGEKFIDTITQLLNSFAS